MNRLFKLAALILLLYIGYTYIKNNNIKYDDIKDKAVEIKDKVKDKVSDYKDDYKTKKNVVNITLAGDLLFEEPFYTAVSKGYSKDKYFSLVKDYFKDDDLSIANMEVVIGNSNMKTSGTGYNFCAPEYVGDLVNTLME